MSERTELEAAAARAAELYVQIATGDAFQRVGAPCTPEEAGAAFAGTLGEHGIGLIEAMAELGSEVVPRSMGVVHPAYLGLMNCSPLPAAPLADLIVSSLNNNGAALEQSPALSACEAEVVRLFRELVGYDGAASGLFLPGGSYANLHGLLLARTKVFPTFRRDGAPPGARPRVYASEVAHFSVARAVGAIGLGESAVVAVPTDGRGAMLPEALEAAITREPDTTPVAVVATVGSTATGAVDPVGPIARITSERGIWLHVDACYGGIGLLVEPLRTRLAALGRADSIAIDPHKGFFVPVAASLALTRHPQLELEAFAPDHASYFPSHGWVDPYRRGLPTSRRAMGFAVWFALRAHGLGEVRRGVERDLAVVRELERLLMEQGFEVLPDGELPIAVARREPPGWAPADVDALQEAIARRVVATGQAWFATARHRGRTWLRFNCVNLSAGPEHARAVADRVALAARIEEALRLG